MNEEDVVFRICVPTYNRGRKALALAQEVLPTLAPGWNLTMIDNCSTQECADYEALARLAQGSGGLLTYIRNPVGVGFHGNYLSCLRHANGKPAMLLSDEDRPGKSIIPMALGILKVKPNVGIVRGGVAPLVPGSRPMNSFTLTDAMYTAGAEALSRYALGNNYFSGTIYNTALLAGHGLIDRLEKKLVKNSIYPHLYFEALSCVVADVALTAEIACLEGPPQVVASRPDDYCLPYSFGGRLDAFLVLRDCLLEAVELMGTPFNSELFGNLYLRHTAKFCYLVGKANAPLYAKNGIDVGVAVRSFAYFACAAMVRLKECELHRDSMMVEIDKVARQYGG